MYIPMSILVMIYFTLGNPLEDLCKLIDAINRLLDWHLARPQGSAQTNWNRIGYRLLTGSLLCMIIIVGTKTFLATIH